MTYHLDMSALISALNDFTPFQIGENGSSEYTWSNNVRERIIQLSFQLTRTRDENSINNFEYFFIIFVRN